MSDEPTLTEALGILGYTTWYNDTPGSRDVINADGSIAFTGKSWQVWAWLRETGQLDDITEKVTQK